MQDLRYFTLGIDARDDSGAVLSGCALTNGAISATVNAHPQNFERGIKSREQADILPTGHCQVTSLRGSRVNRCRQQPEGLQTTI